MLVKNLDMLKQIWREIFIREPLKTGPLTGRACLDTKKPNLIGSPLRGTLIMERSPMDGSHLKMASLTMESSDIMRGLASAHSLLTSIKAIKKVFKARKAIDIFLPNPCISKLRRN